MSEKADLGKKLADMIVYAKSREDRIATAIFVLTERGPCPYPEGNVCTHGIQWDLNCCEKCKGAQIAAAVKHLRGEP